MGNQLPTENGPAPKFSAHINCGQTAVSIRIPLGTEVCLSLGDVALDEDPAPPNFKPMSVVAKRYRWTKMSLGMEVGLGQATLC